jgi:hypothetical protein
MIPIALNPEALRVGLAGRGPALHRRLSVSDAQRNGIRFVQLQHLIIQSTLRLAIEEDIQRERRV